MGLKGQVKATATGLIMWDGTDWVPTPFVYDNTGLVTLPSGLVVTTDVAAATLHTTGDATIGGNADVEGNLLVDGTSHLVGAATVDGALSAASAVFAGTMQAAKADIGGGNPRGTDTANAQNVAGWSHNSSGNWLTVPFDTLNYAIMDDGTIFTAGGSAFASQVEGIYAYHAIITFSNSATGVRGLRWVTQGGTILDECTTVAANPGGSMISSNGLDHLPGGGYAIHVEAYQNSGSTLGVLGHASPTPFSATLAQIA
jgi:hypothetical protein